MTHPNTANLEELHVFYLALFNIIFRHDENLRLTIIEAIRKAIQNPNPDHPWPPAVQELLRSLRDDLLASPDPAIVARVSQPSVHLVDKK